MNNTLKLTLLAFAFGTLVGGTVGIGIAGRIDQRPITEVHGQAGPYRWKVIRVLDGDTVEVDAKFWPNELGHIKIRVYGVDTPESGGRAKCDRERDRAQKAKNAAKELLLGREIEVSSIVEDKYGGRLVGVVKRDGIDYADYLIKHNLAAPYYGKTKQSWC